MLEDVFLERYWKQFLLMEKELRKTDLYTTISRDNFETYSDNYLKILLQIGSEVDVVAKVLCREINSSSTADTIVGYRSELLTAFPEIEQVTVRCKDIDIKPWDGWSNDSPVWWKVYNGVKHNREKIETYGNLPRENYKFANLENVIKAMAALYLLEIYLFTKITDASLHLDTPIPGSRLYKAIDHGWEGKNTYQDITLYVENGCLSMVSGSFLYSDL